MSKNTQAYQFYRLLQVNLAFIEIQESKMAKTSKIANVNVNKQIHEPKLLTNSVFELQSNTHAWPAF